MEVDDGTKRTWFFRCTYSVLLSTSSLLSRFHSRVALRRVRLHQGRSTRYLGLLQGYVDAKLHCLYCWSCRFIAVAAPLDVVKTRIQNAKFGQNASGVQVIREMLVSEGVSGFFKGLTPNVRSPNPWLCRVVLDVLALIDSCCWPDPRVQLHPRAIAYSILRQLCLI